ncbi:hypothetical protein HUU05_28280 [candidate division KSB1 bacterium]|nr:hypothetical protein [candidate division KSB1 bacterium]
MKLSVRTEHTVPKKTLLVRGARLLAFLKYAPNSAQCRFSFVARFRFFGSLIDVETFRRNFSMGYIAEGNGVATSPLIGHCDNAELLGFDSRPHANKKPALFFHHAGTKAFAF